jgi:hypothetical protein
MHATNCRQTTLPTESIFEATDAKKFPGTKTKSLHYMTAVGLAYLYTVYTGSIDGCHFAWILQAACLKLNFFFGIEPDFETQWAADDLELHGLLGRALHQ